MDMCGLYKTDHMCILSFQALEYAKTIIRPRATQRVEMKPNENNENKNAFDHSVFFQLGMDGSRLEMLRKRHEEEKQLVAHFHRLSAGPSASSVNTH